MDVDDTPDEQQQQRDMTDISGDIDDDDNSCGSETDSYTDSFDNDNCFSRNVPIHLINDNY